MTYASTVLLQHHFLNITVGLENMLFQVLQWQKVSGAA